MSQDDLDRAAKWADRSAKASGCALVGMLLPLALVLIAVLIVAGVIVWWLF